MAFYGSTNRAVLPVANGGTPFVALNALKTALQLAGWTIQGSGNGAAAFSNNAVPGPAASDNTGNFTVDNSWVRLREPSPGTREYVFLRGSSTTVLAKYSRSSGFGTGGSAIACPTTGATGDGCVIFGTNLGFSATGSGTNAAPYDMGSTNNTSALTLQTGAGNFRLSVVASDTATNGVWGWWLMVWAEITGALSFIWYTDAVDAATCSPLDNDPSYRQIAGTWWGTDVPTLNRTNYWQGYPASWTSPATTANYRFDGIGWNYWTVFTTSYTPSVTIWNNTISDTVPGLNPYNNQTLLTPFWIMTNNVAGVPPKGMSTNAVMAFGNFNLTETLNLSSASPKIIIGQFGSGPAWLAFPWVTNIQPLV